MADFRSAFLRDHTLTEIMASMPMRWKLFKESGWSKYQVVPSLKGVDSVLEYIAVYNPDFNDLGPLIKQIESKDSSTASSVAAMRECIAAGAGPILVAEDGLEPPPGKARKPV